MRKVSKIGVFIASVITLMSFTGCNGDDDLKIVDSYEVLKLSSIAMHRDRGNIRVTEAESPNNTIVEEDKSDNVGSKFNPNEIIEQPGNRSYVTKFGYSQLKLENKDTTEYFEIVGDDIVYGNTTYVGLNKALDTVEYPYDKTTLTNFIVKTYDPMDVKVEASFVKTDENGSVDGWSVGLSESLEDAWDDYTGLKDSYGKPVDWMITIADYDTFDRQSYLYGCSDYVVYLSYTVGETIDMSNFEEIKPE